MLVKLRKVLHSFGKVPVREFSLRNLEIVCGEEKARKTRASFRVNQSIPESLGTPISHDYA
jgi:hypothetical protein